MTLCQIVDVNPNNVKKFFDIDLRIKFIMKYEVNTDE